ncbi:uncharacterized protein LOC125652519 [Ostrea edulis]|uniref:uncharacterized protein LOC125652519 n=1 Tax=Ostrea edulis TaxID=37623 RepID=UPI002094BF1E|nr:uncharacterized protein LOC125652519 [Ostrea edulis]
MGGTCSGVSTINDLPKKILIIGNSGAGKTHLLYSWLLGRNDLDTIPTDSFNVERVSSDSVYMMWDLCGREDFRLKRRQFFHGTDGVVYIIDPLSDKDDVVNDLTMVSTDRDLNQLPFLVLINKKDEMTTDLRLTVEDALGSHAGLIHVMDVNVMNMESVSSTLRQLNKMFTS